MNHNSLNYSCKINRDRLNQLLETVVQTHPAVVYAGAGYGKTHAVSSWLAGTDHRSVWHSITVLDNVPSRFWERFTVAIEIHKPELAKKMKKLGFPETLQAFNIFLTALTEELYQEKRFVALVFDDMHHLKEPIIQKFLTALIDARMENNSIILISREWPLWGMDLTITPRLIGIEELRFTSAETYELFIQAGLHLTLDEAAKIRHYVTGWPIALSVVIHHLLNHEDETRPPQFSCTKPVLFRLFETEIFSQYTEVEQALLIKLSALESFPRKLVVAVSGERNRDIQDLLKDNPFVRYDVDAQRFYFHPLYQEYLREKLLSVSEEELQEEYLRAGDWCLEEGHFYDAVEYYRRCGNYRKIWESFRLIKAGRHSKTEAEFFINELQMMPESLKQEEPMIQIVLAVMLVNNLRFSEAQQTIQEVKKELEAQASTPEQQLLLGECHIARALILMGMEAGGFEAEFKEAARLLPNGSRRWGKGLHLVDFGPSLSLQKTEPGELEKSAASFTAAITDLTHVLHGAGTGIDYLCRCEALYLKGEVKAAIEPAYHALYAATAAGQYDIAGNALFILLRIYSVLGEYKNIMDILHQVENYQNNPVSSDLGIWDIIKGWFYSGIGETGQVAGWIRNAVHSGLPPLSIKRPMLIKLRCLLIDGSMAEALALSEQFEDLAKSNHAVIPMIYIELTRTIIHNANGHIEAAIATLTAAYRLAEGNDIVMPFIECGNRMRSLLERVRSMGNDDIPEAWIDRIHARASTNAKRHTYLAASYKHEMGKQQADFGLSRRETELLTHLSQGLTREEIGICMNLSMNTVKSMMKQIFAKLGAINSVDAVRIVLMNRLI